MRLLLRGGKSPSHPLLSWLIAAALVHVFIALLVVIFGASARKASNREPVATEEKSVEIDLAVVADELTTTSDGKIAIANANVASATQKRERAASNVELGSVEPPSSPPAEGNTTSDAPAPPSAAVQPEAPPIPLGALGIGAAGFNPFLRPGALPEKKPDPNDNTAGRALRTGLQERDLALGLGPEGPVLDALRDGVAMTASPERGYAIFAVVVDANGFVTDIRLGDRGGGTGWDEARNHALSSLKGKKLTLRGGAKGAELKIEIKSDVVLPSGNRVGERIKPTFKESHVARPENVPGGTPDVVQTRTVATFDVTDIGAKPRRVVHAHLVSATML